MEQYSEAYIGLDVSKLRNAVAVAEGGRNGEIRYGFVNLITRGALVLRVLSSYAAASDA